MEAFYTILGLAMMTFHIRGVVLLFKHSTKHQYNSKWIYIACGVGQILLLMGALGAVME